MSDRFLLVRSNLSQNCGLALPAEYPGNLAKNKAAMSWFYADKNDNHHSPGPIPIT